ncbi:MAG: ScyD/ScyE family protein [Chloroflexota bacterium]|nr:ScyD/ScyE family protein [Chloroflexota bacterium]
MNRKSIVVGLALICVVILGTGPAAAAKAPSGTGTAVLLVSGLQGGSGSTVGPDGALYVTERTAGRISRVDPRTGAVSTFASGLPKELAAGGGFGGPVDVAFIGKTAYALVTLVGPDLGGNSVVGIYRIDGPNQFTVVADIGAFALRNPPPPIFKIDVPSGVQYALEVYRGGFLVTDGHHNRVLRVSLDGQVTELIQFGDIVPTGLAVSGNTVYMAEAGPVPHRPQDGKVVAFRPGAHTATQVASGAPLLVDVEFGRGHRLYALSQGTFSGGPEGSPALPNTGALVRANRHGGFTVVTGGLDRPTSLEFIGSTAYVVTLTGEIWRIDDVGGPPHERGDDERDDD